MDPVSNPPPSDPALNPALGRRSFLGWVTYGLGAVAAAVMGIPFIGYLFGAEGAGQVVARGARQRFSARPDPPGDFQQPHPPAVGRYGGSYRCLRALQGPRRARGRRDEGTYVSGTGRQLRPPRLPGRVVPGVGAVHVPLSRRRLLRQRRTRLGPPPRGLYRCVCRVTRAGGVLQLEIQAPHFPTRQDTLEQG